MPIIRTTKSARRNRVRSSISRSSRARISWLRLESLDDRIVPSFAEAVHYAAGTNPQSVVAADFNGDGRLDLAVANHASSAGSVNVLLGNANGTFQPALSSPAGSYLTSIAVGDFNNDNRIDLVTRNFSDVSVLMGNGNGRFQTPVSVLSSSTASGEITSVSVGDFNADGKLDLGALSTSSGGGWGPYGYYGSSAGALTVLLGTGNGSFSNQGNLTVGDDRYTAGTVADFNGDGKLDFAAAGDYLASVMLGNGTGGFGYPSHNPFISPMTYAPLVASDLNGDGKLDLARGRSDWGAMGVIYGSGNGQFSSYTFLSNVAYSNYWSTADFNGDNNPDVIGTGNSSTVFVQLGNGASGFLPPISSHVGAGPAAVAVGDFNGDGRLDVASANSGSNNLSVLINDGHWLSPTAPSVSANRATVTEGNTGTTNATFTVSLSAASSQTITVNYSTRNGTASAAAGDYQPKSGTLTFAPGETSKPVTVLVNGDREPESSESFSLDLTSPNAWIMGSPGTELEFAL